MKHRKIYVLLVTVLLLFTACGTGLAGSIEASKPVEEDAYEVPVDGTSFVITIDTFEVASDGSATYTFLDEGGNDFAMGNNPDNWFANAALISTGIPEGESVILNGSGLDFSSVEKLLLTFEVEDIEYGVIVSTGTQFTVMYEGEELQVILDENWTIPAEEEEREE